MARSIATVYGTALVPGVSRNGRLYTREIIAAAVDRAQERIASGNMDILLDEDADPRPLTQRTHHAADDDTTQLIGRLTSLTLDESTGAAKFAAVLADTKPGHAVLNLVDTSDGAPAFLRGVSIRGAWLGSVRREVVDGRTVETADGLDLDGLDYTANPGVIGARVERVVRTQPMSPQESAGERVLIYESVQEAVVDPTSPNTTITETAPATDAEPVHEQEPTRFADIGYLTDKARRLPLDTPAQARAAWLAVAGTNPTAEGYTEPQRKRVRERAVKALREHGFTVDATEQWLISPPAPVTEALAECWDCEPGSSFYVTLDNGMVCVSVSSYRIDPADLAVVARAAMDGACNTLAGLDPDNDGDVDVDALDAPAETAAPAEQVTETAAAPTAPATTPAADITHHQEESLVSDETTTAAATEQPAAAAAPAAVTLSNDQFAQLLAAARGPQAPAGPVATAAAETAPAEQAATTEAAPAAAVTETDEQRIERIVGERLTVAVQQVVEKYGPPARKGLSTPLEESGPLNTETGLPEGWPQKPLDKYTEAERSEYFGAALQTYVLGNRANLG